MSSGSSANSTGESFANFATRAGALGGLSKDKVLQGIGDLLQMEQILGAKEWRDSPSTVQVARLKSKIGQCEVE